jgi:cell wall-associated NlpC family hydrolase
VGAAVAVASARADGTATTTSTTTTATTTTTTAQSFAPLASSSLPVACVGAGAAALVLPSQRVIAFGTPASSLGPSAYGSVLTFDSAAASGAPCKSAAISLSSVSLFDGAVTASSVQATDGRGSATGLAIDGSAVTAAAGQTVLVDDWGQLTLGGTTGRLTAPLVLHLLQAHDSLPAGTAVVVAFGASARSVPKSPATQYGQATGSPRSAQAGKTTDSRKHRQRARRPPPDFPASPSPLNVDSLTDAARDNPVVSLALKYLGVPYQWGGATPAMGFDCSGLVTYVFGKLGVSLPHYAASQWYSPDAVWVAPNRLQPGDLVFFVGSDGTRKSPGHVGIYVDDGYIVDAPHTGSFVRIDRLGEPRLADGYVGAKRIVSSSLDRHLLGATKPAESTAVLPGFPSPLTIEPLAESLGVAAAGAAVTPGGLWWAGVVLGGVILLLLAGGGVLHRRALRAE